MKTAYLHALVWFNDIATLDDMDDAITDQSCQLEHEYIDSFDIVRVKPCDDKTEGAYAAEISLRLHLNKDLGQDDIDFMFDEMELEIEDENVASVEMTNLTEGVNPV